MPESISFARSGEPIVSLDGSLLHSRYDPRSEAERYIASLNIKDAVDTFLIIEPGAGYLCAAVRCKWPAARILIARCSCFFKSADSARVDSLPDGEWFPDGSMSFDSFLEKNIIDAEAGRVKLIDWKPAIAAYRDAARSLVTAAAVFLKRSAANARTVSQFGVKWVRNALAFSSMLSVELRAKQGTAPAVVTASGPSLEPCLEELKRAKETGSAFIIAVSSSVPALLASGVRPDLAIATDGGGWANFHLHEAIRSHIPLAAAVSAALPSSAFESPVLPLRDQSHWQALIAELAALSAFSSPQRGTVAISAMDLAMSMTTGPVYLAGFDLGVSGGRTHARPNALDRFYEDPASRVRPAFSAAYERYLAAHRGQSLGIYADWLSDRLDAYASRVRILRSASDIFSRFPHRSTVERLQDQVLPALIATPRAGVSADARRSEIATEMETFLDKEARLFSDGNRATIELFEARTALGELFELLCPDDFSRELAKVRSGAAAPITVQRTREKLEAALEALR